MFTASKTPMRQKSVKGRLVKAKKHSAEEQYAHFFISAPSPLWRNDDVDFSLEQPHFFEDVPTETVYISPALTHLCLITNA